MIAERRFKIAAALLGALALAACQPISGSFDRAAPGTVLADGGAQHPLDTRYHPSDEPVREGLKHYYAGNFGLAQRHFQDGVEKSPRDVTAWVGLAASYDRLRRFDLADEAYGHALALKGPSVEILNNQGYSHLLRGDLKGARAKFLAAYELAPDDPVINNNLVLLSSSAGMVERHPGAY